MRPVKLKYSIKIIIQFLTGLPPDRFACIMATKRLLLLDQAV